MKEAVIFKGTKDGLCLVLNEELDFTGIKNGLTDKLQPSKKFFSGAKIIDFKGKSLSNEEYRELKSILTSEYDMIVPERIEKKLWMEEPADLEEAQEPEMAEEDEFHLEELHYHTVERDDSLFLRGTIRSGQSICFSGNIVIIGDVNPGAYLRAGRNIIVMGNLRGIAHAGANGDYGATISAFNLIPTQLRIGDIITKAPSDEKQVGKNFPEIASVKNGTIMVESYQSTNEAKR